MKYKISRKVIDQITQFYTNVAKKYCNTWTQNDIKNHISITKSAIYKIENGLLRQKPKISRWKGLYMATSRDRKWNFAYRIEDNIIYVEDACHAQNMHESKHIIRLTKSELREVIKESIRTILKERNNKRKREVVEYRLGL